MLARSGIIFQRKRKRKTDKGEDSWWGWAVSYQWVSWWQELIKPWRRGMRVWGRGLALGAVLVLLATGLLPVLLGREEARQKAREMKKSQITFGDLLRIEAENKIQVREATFFTVEIDKIGAKSKVIANVDPGDKGEYQKALKEGIAHAAGTYLPGMGEGITLFAHSTDTVFNVERFNAVFYRLDELKPGDEIAIWYLGEKRVYQVEKSWVTGPEDVEVFKRKEGEEKLFLVTCTPRGTNWNRLVVEAGLLDR